MLKDGGAISAVIDCVVADSNYLFGIALCLREDDDAMYLDMGCDCVLNGSDWINIAVE